MRLTKSCRTLGSGQSPEESIGQNQLRWQNVKLLCLSGMACVAACCGPPPIQPWADAPRQIGAGGSFAPAPEHNPDYRAIPPALVAFSAVGLRASVTMPSSIPATRMGIWCPYTCPSWIQRLAVPALPGARSVASASSLGRAGTREERQPEQHVAIRQIVGDANSTTGASSDQRGWHVCAHPPDLRQPTRRSAAGSLGRCAP